MEPTGGADSQLPSNPAVPAGSPGHGATTPEHFESSNYRPGEPLRSWVYGDPVVGIDADLLMSKAGARESIRKLVRGETLDVEDIVSFGRLNSFCVLEWYEPMVILVGDPRLDPNLPEILRDFTKLDL